MRGETLEVQIETIVSEVALAGEEGMTFSEFLDIVRRLCSKSATKSADKEGLKRDKELNYAADRPKQTRPCLEPDGPGPDTDTATARWAWDWLRAHPEILINGHRRWNRLTLDEILALPEEPQFVPRPSESMVLDNATIPPATADQNPEIPALSRNTKSKKSLTKRPRICASEDLVWRTVAHHGVDYKRIPQMEWQCLLGIASVRGEGILQGDLTRLVGQDKRSLPKRTDALASKGYVIKRTTVARRVKTSRLWLVDFAPAMVREDSNKDVDLSEDKLRANLDPVAWRARWTGENIDIESLGRTFLAIAQAWHVIRYSHLKTKMGVSHLRWQMKVLAKLCRRLVDMGILAYTAAKLSGAGKIYKDCIKFLREPDQEEWDKLLATGKKTSQYADMDGKREPKSNSLAVPRQQEEALDGDDEGDDDYEAQEDAPVRHKLAWVPEKPMISTLFDIIHQAGLSGITNPQISAAIIGYQFHRFMGNGLTKLAETLQPSHLDHFQIRSELVRVGKVANYVFVASSNIKQTLNQKTDHAEGVVTVEQETNASMTNIPVSTEAKNPYGFSKVYRRVFAHTEASLTRLSKAASRQRLLSTKKRPYPNPERGNSLTQKTEMAQEPEELEELEKSERAYASDMLDAPLPLPVQVEIEQTGDNTPLSRKSSSNEAGANVLATEAPAIEMLPGKPPGAYIGLPGSLNPPRKKQGRPRRSCVIIFRLDQLKDPNRLTSQSRSPTILAEDRPTTIQISDQEQLPPESGDPQSPGVVVVGFKPTNMPDVTNPASHLSTGPGRGRGRKKASAGAYRCETCGDSWKNEAGLKYHMTKSQTTCNPDYNPIAAINEKPKRRRQRLASPARQSEAAAMDLSSNAKGAASEAEQAWAISPNTPRPSIRRQIRTHETCTSSRGLNPGDIRVAMTRLAKELANESTGTRAHASKPRETQRLAQHWLGVEDQKKLRRKANGKVNSDARDAKDQADGASHIQHSSSSKLGSMVTSHSPPQDKRSATHPPLGQTPKSSRLKTLSPPNVLLVKPAQEPTTVVLTDGQDSMDVHSPSGDTARDKQGLNEFVPFQCHRNYDAIPSISKRRHAQFSDIVSYVLDNSNGIFPGGKALFFTIVKVFLDSFEGEAPLTWAYFQKALKRMDQEKVTATHVHFLRDTSGRMVTYSIVIRHGVDIDSKLVASLKRKVRETHPNIFIPEPFSFSEEDISALEQLSGCDQVEQPDPSKVVHRNGPTFRLRRAQIQDVEVLDAPYYERQSERVNDIGSEEEAETPTKRLKRPGPPREDDHMTKRQRTSHSTPTKQVKFAAQPKFAEFQDENEAEEQDIEPEGSARESGDDMSTDEEAFEFIPGQKLSVAQAVKVYGLLPMKGKLGSRSQAQLKKLGKLPASLGRSRNPGLKSLPVTFFADGAQGASNGCAPSRLEFLQPNTRLGDSDEEGEGSTFTSQTELDLQDDSPAPHEVVSEDSNIDAVFTPFSVIDEHVENDEGSYPVLDTSFFEKEGTSFVLRGRLPDSSWFFRQRMPDSLDELIKLAPGSLGRHPKWADPNYGEFCSQVDRCLRWDLATKWQESHLSGQTLAPNYSFINISAPEQKSNMEPARLEWEDDNQFDLETLPYDELDAAMEDDGIDYEEIKPRRGERLGVHSPVQPRLKQSRRSKTSLNAMQVNERSLMDVELLKKKRPLTALPASSNDFIRTLEEDKDQEGWKSEHTRLVAFVVVRTLLGGVGGVIDWGLLMRLFPGQSAAQLRRFWTGMKKDRQSTITALTNKFRKAFIKAYESNEVPAINFDDLANYDWKFIIDWARNLSNAADGISELPESRQVLEDTYVICDREVMDREWRERYFSSTRSVHHRLQDVTSEPMARSIDKTTAAPDADSCALTVAMSWIRALCVTPEDQYPRETIVRRLESLCGLKQDKVEDILGRAHRQLQAQKVVTKSGLKHAYERGWRLNNRVVSVLEKGCKLEQFSQAVAYKQELDVAFRGGGKKRVTYITDDGMIMALINLQACRRICIETTGQPQVPLGFEPGNYETRKFPKRYYHFRLDVSPTDAYVYHDDPTMTELRDRICATKPPSKGPDGAVPIWCDLFGKIDQERWLKYVGLVLFHLAARGAMRAKELARILKATIMEFEAELILDWGASIGIVGVPFPGSAPNIKEWWWAAIDAQREAFEIAKARKKLPASGNYGAMGTE